jgi:hypothetical protein
LSVLKEPALAICNAKWQLSIDRRFYTHRTSKFGTFTPSLAGEGWGEEIIKTEF